MLAERALLAASPLSFRAKGAISQMADDTVGIKDSSAWWLSQELKQPGNARQDHFPSPDHAQTLKKVIPHSKHHI